MIEFLRTQNRYAQLERSLPEDAEPSQRELNDHLVKRHVAMKERSEQKLLTLYFLLAVLEVMASGDVDQIGRTSFC